MSGTPNQRGQIGRQRRVLFEGLNNAVHAVYVASLARNFGWSEMEAWKYDMEEMFYLNDFGQFGKAFDLVFKTNGGACYLAERLMQLSRDIEKHKHTREDAVVWCENIRERVFTPTPQELMAKLDQYLAEVANRSGRSGSIEKEHSIQHVGRISARRSLFYRLRASNVADSDGFVSLV